MTDKTLRIYYQKNRSTYEDFSRCCSSVAELQLKIAIYGKRWSQWDWVLLLSSVIKHMMMDNKNSSLLYTDILQELDNNSQLDEIFTNKQVILNIIHILNGKLIDQLVKDKLCTLVAHVFKKFPSLWNISWMQARYIGQLHKIVKYHRLRSHVKHKTTDDNKYFNSKQYYLDFIALHI